MAQQVTPVIMGADVDSRYIQIACYGSSEGVRIDNQGSAIRRWLKSLSGPVCLAVEATGRYHLELVDQAHAAGVTVYLIDPYRLSRYRDGVGERHKTDVVDARLLARYLAHEQGELRVFRPVSAGHRQAWSLLKRRAKLVQAEGMISESLGAMRGLSGPVATVKRHLAKLIQAIERELNKQLQQLGLADDYRRLQTIRGVGPLTAAALVLAFHRGEFTKADAFVAYLGMDIRIRRSGKYKGREKLTKKGDPECRRLLHNAARAAARTDHKAYYERLLARRFASTQAHVAVARKLVRIAFAMLKNHQNYDPTKVKMA